VIPAYRQVYLPSGRQAFRNFGQLINIQREYLINKIAVSYIVGFPEERVAIDVIRENHIKNISLL